MSGIALSSGPTRPTPGPIEYAKPDRTEELVNKYADALDRLIKLGEEFQAEKAAARDRYTAVSDRLANKENQVRQLEHKLRLAATDAIANEKTIDDQAKLLLVKNENIAALQRSLQDARQIMGALREKLESLQPRLWQDLGPGERIEYLNARLVRIEEYIRNKADAERIFKAGPAPWDQALYTRNDG